MSVCGNLARIKQTVCVSIAAAVTHFGGECLSLVAAAETCSHSQDPEIIQPQEPVWPLSLGRATQASLPLAAPPRRSAATSDAATSGLYLEHKDEVCLGSSCFKDSPRTGQRGVPSQHSAGPAAPPSKAKCWNYPQPRPRSSLAAARRRRLVPLLERGSGSLLARERPRAGRSPGARWHRRRANLAAVAAPPDCKAAESRFRMEMCLGQTRIQSLDL